jgi:hypothetical protein
MSAVSGPTLARLDRRVAPLSFAQERLWFIDAAAPGSATYNVPLFLRWREPLDPDALGRALAAVVARHEVLRTTYELRDGRPVQVVGAPGPVPIEVVDAPPGGADGIRQAALHRVRQPFDLAAEPPVRCIAWRGGPAGDAVLLVVHHIAIDGWSLAVFFDDLATAYEAALAAASPAFAAPPIRYADFAVWDRETFAGPAVERHLAERVDELLAVPGGLALGEWREPPARPEGARPGGQHTFAIGDDLWAGVERLARRLRATPFVVAFAAYQEVLRRWSGRDEFLVGTVVANRPHPLTERLVGFFVNTVPLRCRVRPGASFARLCADTRAEAFAALKHQRIPFDQLVARAGTVRGRESGGAGGGAGSGRAALVEVGFALQNMPAPEDSPRWAPPELLPTGTAKFDLILILDQTPGGVLGTVEYDADRYPERVGCDLGEQFRVLLSAAVAEPERALVELPLTDRAGGSGAPPCVVIGARRDLVGERLARLTGRSV